MKVVVRLVVVVLVLLLGAGGFWFYRSRSTSTVSAATGSVYTQLVDVRKGDLSAAITVVGELDAVQNADLAFTRMSGTTKLVELKVQAGNTVLAGQSLATIDAAPYQQALDQARSDLQAAETTLADLKAPSTDLAIAQADLAIAQAEAQIQQAQSDLADLRSPDLTTLQNAVQNAQDNLTLIDLEQTLADYSSLAKTERDLNYTSTWFGRRATELQDIILSGKPNLEQRQEMVSSLDQYNKLHADLVLIQTQRQLSRQSTAATKAKYQADLADAQDALAQGQAGGDPLALAQAQLAVRTAEVALAQAREDRTKLDEGADAVELASAQAAADKKRLAVTDAEAALVGAELVAPFDGTILQTYTRLGDLITADTTIVTMASLTTLQVVASVDETMIRQVALGQKTQITFDAFPGQRCSGEVLSVPLQGTLQGDVMVYEVPVSLNGAEKLPLLVGMTANVQIQIGQVTDALLVPAMALQRVQGMYQVMVPNTTDPAGQPETVPVEVGLNDGTNAQIVRGLNLGDKVVVQMQASQSNQFNLRGGFGMNPLMGGARPRD
jgi:HlyD family secretion protein